MFKLIVFISFLFSSINSFSDERKNFRLSDVEICSSHMDAFEKKNEASLESALEELGSFIGSLPNSKKKTIARFNEMNESEIATEILSILQKTYDYFYKSYSKEDELNKKLALVENTFRPYLEFWGDRVRFAPKKGTLSDQSFTDLFVLSIGKLKGTAEELRVALSVENVTILEAHVHTLLSEEEKRFIEGHEDLVHALDYEMDIIQEFSDGKENWIEVKHLTEGFGTDNRWSEKIGKKMSTLTRVRDILKREFNRNISIQIHIHGDGNITRTFKDFLKSYDVVIDTDKVPSQKTKRSLPRSYFRRM